VSRAFLQNSFLLRLKSNRTHLLASVVRGRGESEVIICAVSYRATRVLQSDVSNPPDIGLIARKITLCLARARGKSGDPHRLGNFCMAAPECVNFFIAPTRTAVSSVTDPPHIAMVGQCRLRNLGAYEEHSKSPSEFTKEIQT
jgi:hypothetical protein